MIFCEPNAGFYETHVISRDLLDLLFSKGYNIILWNYSGYSLFSKTDTTLESVKQNLKNLITTLRKNINID